MGLIAALAAIQLAAPGEAAAQFLVSVHCVLIRKNGEANPVINAGSGQVQLCESLAKACGGSDYKDFQHNSMPRTFKDPPRICDNKPSTATQTIVPPPKPKTEPPKQQAQPAPKETKRAQRVKGDPNAPAGQKGSAKSGLPAHPPGHEPPQAGATDMMPPPPMPEPEIPKPANSIVVDNACNRDMYVAVRYDQASDGKRVESGAFPVGANKTNRVLGGVRTHSDVIWAWFQEKPFSLENVPAWIRFELSPSKNDITDLVLPIPKC